MFLFGWSSSCCTRRIIFTLFCFGCANLLEAELPFPPVWKVQARARIESVPFPKATKSAPLVSAGNLRVTPEKALLLPPWPLTVVRNRQHELADYLLVLPCRSLIDRLIQIVGRRVVSLM